MNIYIYQNNPYTKKDELVVGVIAPSLEEFNEEPSKFYPNIPEGIFVTSETRFDYPIVEGNTVRNKTREEKILLDNETSLLNQGEYVESNQIKFKECPIGLYKPQWVSPNWVEGATLEEVQKHKREELQKGRDSQIIAPYEYNTVIYQADLNSQDKFFKAMQLGKGKEQPIEWIALDNSTHLLTNNDLINIVNGISERELESFNKFNELYGQVLLCETIDEIKVIVW